MRKARSSLWAASLFLVISAAGQNVRTRTPNSDLTGTHRNLTFNAAGDISVSGNIATGSGTLAKQGPGEIIIGAGATLTPGMDFSNAGLNIRLAGHRLAVGALNGTAASAIDFRSGGNSVLTLDTLGFDATGVQLTVQNWADKTDYFHSSTGYAPGGAPLNQVQFQGWTTADTKRQGDDSQVTPVPEPVTDGAWLLAGALAGGRRRWHA